ASARLLPRSGNGRSRPLLDLLDGEAIPLPSGEAARDLGRPPSQGRLRAEGALAEVDAARPRRTCQVLDQRDASRPGWGAVPTTLELGPQVENLREAKLDRIPRRPGLESTRHCREITPSSRRLRAPQSARKASIEAAARGPARPSQSGISGGSLGGCSASLRSAAA